MNPSSALSCSDARIQDAHPWCSMVKSCSGCVCFRDVETRAIYRRDCTVLQLHFLPTMGQDRLYSVIELER